MISDVIDGYCADAADLTPRYECVKPATLFAPVAGFLSQTPARILDVGAGTGRNAAWFAEQGHDVVAVEPVAEFRETGVACQNTHNIEWLDDRLPDLTGLRQRAEKFDYVVLSAVWHHLEDTERAAALTVLHRFLVPTGRLIMSLRMGPGVKSRPDYPTRPDDVANMAADAGFKLEFTAHAASVQQHNASAGVSWVWLVFKMA